jgi:hypothetical protein
MRFVDLWLGDRSDRFEVVIGERAVIIWRETYGGRTSRALMDDYI